MPGAGLHAVNGPPDTVVVAGSAQLDVRQEGTIIAATEPTSTAVRVQLPPRFCGLRVSTAGGTIELVGQLNEASLEARSAGGAIALQRARTTDAALHSGGGAVSGGELSASRAVVRSGGGAVALKRLFGLDIEVSSVAEGGGSDPGGARRRRRSESVYASVGASSSDASTSSGSSSSGSSSSGSIGNDSGAICTSSGGDSATVSGGDIELGAAYGERASFHTGGGGFKVAHMSCSGLVAVDTSGGGIHIEGLEGNASLLSGGGLVQVHLHERFGSCFIDSAGGNIEVLISPAAAVASLQVQADGGIAIDPALRVSGELGPSSCVGTIGGGGGSGAAAAAAAFAGAAPAEAHAAASAHVASARRAGSLGFSTEVAVQAQVAGDPNGGGGGVPGAVWNASRLSRGMDASGGITHGGGSKLVVNAGAGRATLRALSWVEAVARKAAQTMASDDAAAHAAVSTLAGADTAAEAPTAAPVALREDQIASAVAFLSHEKVRASPVATKRSFLERKGLTAAEIDEAFKRAPQQESGAPLPAVAAVAAAPAPVAAATPTYGANNLVTYTPGQPQPHYQQQQQYGAAPPHQLVAMQPGTLAPPHPPQPQPVRWTQVLLGLGIVTGAAYAAAHYVAPLVGSWYRSLAESRDRERREAAERDAALAAALEGMAASQKQLARAVEGLSAAVADGRQERGGGLEGGGGSGKGAGGGHASPGRWRREGGARGGGGGGGGGGYPSYSAEDGYSPAPPPRYGAPRYGRAGGEPSAYADDPRSVDAADEPGRSGAPETSFDWPRHQAAPYGARDREQQRFGGGYGPASPSGSASASAAAPGDSRTPGGGSGGDADGASYVRGGGYGGYGRGALPAYSAAASNGVAASYSAAQPAPRPPAPPAQPAAAPAGRDDAPHSQAFMSVMEMVARGETPPNQAAPAARSYDYGVQDGRDAPWRPPPPPAPTVSYAPAAAATPAAAPTPTAAADEAAAAQQAASRVAAAAVQAVVAAEAGVAEEAAAVAAAGGE
ncbi:hypothetical protein MNEG_5615 [Monoraphidium neglectum]|uniref:Peroxisomal membrane protein PEX14 n=1 Tax=Monoraphidium neglectum TaxID=145388 RepID=A0A0D2MGZ2_9CHLO|nr:hypothetical protein MNEG_5615 [Monoraphidium neglectum]KIZ02345.1 hypothetical protein MNEG_5615 [Monoraphidium neglectum]|eukprot:XP_013901364.1 hypothetical protein MNEG_5615 [Monoraphidium neglectum]